MAVPAPGVAAQPQPAPKSWGALGGCAARIGWRYIIRERPLIAVDLPLFMTDRACRARP
jgi:hypothetical protein